MPALSCPVCEGSQFDDFNGRAGIRCRTCGSLERGRQMWLVLGSIVTLPAGATVGHFAPEEFMMDRFALRTDIRYQAFDKHPQHYAHPIVEVEELDLCADTARIAGDAFDLLIHNHVLEHLPCRPQDVLAEMKRMLKPGGVMIFSVPIVGDRSIEGLDAAVTQVEREMRAAQGDHLRIFGKVDFPAMLRRVLGDDCLLRQSAYATAAQIERANIPLADNEPNGKSIFLYRKR